jgi:hypothetical protein
VLTRESAASASTVRAICSLGKPDFSVCSSGRSAAWASPPPRPRQPSSRYALEDRSPWFILAFAVSCALGSVYGFLQGAWPFGVVEAIWAAVAARRWRIRAKSS